MEKVKSEGPLEIRRYCVMLCYCVLLSSGAMLCNYVMLCCCVIALVLIKKVTSDGPILSCSALI
jgi:hypothetical protein